MLLNITGTAPTTKNELAQSVSSAVLRLRNPAAAPGPSSYKHTSFYCMQLYCASQILCFFLQTEGKRLHQQKDYNFIAVIWIKTCNISKVCLYFSLASPPCLSFPRG